MSTDRHSGSDWLSQLPFSNFLRIWNYRPRTEWFDHFVNINWNAGDAGVEQHVLGEVGSYGLQLSTILDAVNLLVGQLHLTDLTEEQRKVVVRLQDLTTKATDAVADYRSEQRASPT